MHPSKVFFLVHLQLQMAKEFNLLNNSFNLLRISSWLLMLWMTTKELDSRANLSILKELANLTASLRVQAFVTERSFAETSPEFSTEKGASGGSRDRKANFAFQ
ncbi:conserved hypothetical protein [Ricinus communis]|uniref:Uncharacterized protein n=1 Tax=Ricinus communis TaxID=3988 RepID=B9RN26_RICCO|nr:conserved hypothetical protein [Ricinus communis]